jgi:hypothetical protein
MEHLQFCLGHRLAIGQYPNEQVKAGRHTPLNPEREPGPRPGVVRNASLDLLDKLVGQRPQFESE